MSIAVKNLEDRVKGATSKEVKIILWDNPTTRRDITGATIECEFRYRNKDGVLQATFSIASGITLIDAAQGEFQIDAIDSLDWPLGTYYYDIKMTEGTYEYFPVGGTMQVINSVTKL